MADTGNPAARLTTCDFIEPSSEQSERYWRIHRELREIMRVPDGMMLVFNALMTTDDNVPGLLKLWLEFATDGPNGIAWDGRDLQTVIPAHLISLPRFV